MHKSVHSFEASQHAHQVITVCTGSMATLTTLLNAKQFIKGYFTKVEKKILNVFHKDWRRVPDRQYNVLTKFTKNIEAINWECEAK